MRFVPLPIFLLCSIALAQREPHLGYVYPAGGKQGTTFQVTIGGQFLEGVDNIRVTGPGVQARIVNHTRPITPQMANRLRERIDQLESRRRSTTQPLNDDEKKEILEIREKLMKFQRRPSSPAIAEIVTAEIKLASDASMEPRTLRLQTPAGLTNPLVFCVGQLPEISQPAQEPAGQPTRSVPRNETNITIPATINGQTMPGGVDRYYFHARAGQRLVIAASARSLIPYLADAVPGWFQAAITLYDPSGHEAAYADHFRFNPDPVIYYTTARDGDYALEIHDSIYRGREDFVYRITIGPTPFITDRFPLGGGAQQDGEPTNIQLTGWNLPAVTTVFDATDKKPGVYPLSIHRGQWLSNPQLFEVSDLPECLEKEPNNTSETAQPVTLPIVINGRIDKPGDRDIFRFEGHTGEKIVAEVNARRLNSSLDSVLSLTDSTGKQIAYNDDRAERNLGLETHHADSYLPTTLPSDGIYCLQITDAQNQGGNAYAYRLRISHPRPDFELRVTPSAVNVKAGQSASLNVYVLREDGFTGEVTLSLRDAPAGFNLGNTKIPGSQDQAKVNLKVPWRSEATTQPTRLVIEGRATIEDKPVVHPAIAAEDMMQAFFYRHLVEEGDLQVCVLPGRPRRVARNRE